MEKAKISAVQLFVLMLLFELGSSLLVPLAIEAKQDAWLAILFGMTGGCFLFLIYYALYRYYPDSLPTTYVQSIVGKPFGRVLAFLYIIYFAYLAARVLRDFGEMLLTFAYQETPLFIVNALLIITVIYTVRKGIEVLARAGEILFLFMYVLAVTGFILVIVSGSVDLNNLKPVLEKGILPVVRVAWSQTIYFPFGEIIVFAMILPYLQHSKKAKITGLCALGLSGINLAIVMIVNITVSGVDLVLSSQFPLLNTIQIIQVAEFLERLDVFFMIALVIGGFFKIGLLIYAIVIGTADLLNIKEPSLLAYPIGVIILFLSITIARSFSEHVQEGLQVVPLLLHLPFQVLLPLLLLIVAFFRNRNQHK